MSPLPVAAAEKAIIYHLQSEFHTVAGAEFVRAHKEDGRYEAGHKFKLTMTDSIHSGSTLYHRIQSERSGKFYVKAMIARLDGFKHSPFLLYLLRGCSAIAINNEYI